MTSTEVGIEKEAEMAARVLVTLQPDYTAEEIEQEYLQYKLTSKGLASRSHNIYLFQFDPSTINKIELLALLNKNENIIEAKALSNSKNTLQPDSGKKRATVKLPTR